MTDTRRCPECGTEIPSDAAEGVCPKCLMRLALEGEETSPVDPDPTSPVSPHFRAPEPEELSKRFPQLEILELLGQGGMGAVYKARQPVLDRLVAVKILPPEVAEDPGFTERFTREARALAKLNHSNIVSVYDSGQADGQFYFVMEFVDGLNLRQMLKGGQLEPREALTIVPQICEALQFAHDEGLVHRDIKPENILLDKKGRVKIADFGLAKLLGHSREDFTLTGSRQVMGTPRYMAPEQMEHPLEVDHRADIYSLGVVFYEMLTGELPLGRFPLPSKRVEVDVKMDEVVLRALEKDPEQRYQSARQMRTGLDTAIASSERPSTVEEESQPSGSAPTSDEIPNFAKRVAKPVGVPMLILFGFWFVTLLILLGFSYLGWISEVVVTLFLISGAGLFVMIFVLRLAVWASRERKGG